MGRAAAQARPRDVEGLWEKLYIGSAMTGRRGLGICAIGALDMALWDAVAKAKRVPLWKLLADRHNGGRYDDKAWVYAAGGYYYPGKDLEGLQDEMKHYLGLGYSCVKMKVGGVPLAEDLKRIEAVLKIVGKGERLAVDVNGKFDLPTAIEFGNAIKGYGLRWYEEPLDPLDCLAHAALATQYAPPLATGENLFSMQDARNLIRHGGLRPDRDILQFDPALSYWLVEYLRTSEMLKQNVRRNGMRRLPHLLRRPDGVYVEIARNPRGVSPGNSNTAARESHGILFIPNGKGRKLRRRRLQVAGGGKDERGCVGSFRQACVRIGARIQKMHFFNSLEGEGPVRDDAGNYGSVWIRIGRRLLQGHEGLSA